MYICPFWKEGEPTEDAPELISCANRKCTHKNKYHKACFMAWHGGILPDNYDFSKCPMCKPVKRRPNPERPVERPKRAPAPPPREARGRYGMKTKIK